MTTGPIVPRIPVESGPRPQQKADFEAGRGEDGQSFADLLQVMLAPGAAPAAQPVPSAPETSAAVFERLDAAQVFNETGLFRGAAPLTAQAAPGAARDLAAGDPALPEISPQAALQVLSGGAPEAAPHAGSAAPPGPADRIGLPIGSAATGAPLKRPRIDVRAPVALRGQSAPAPQGAARPSRTDGKSEAVGRTSRTAAMLVQAYLAKGGSAAAQVSVQAVEGGISLVARADKLSREEKDKLLVEIGELLARHGLTAAEIMLNGEAGSSPKGRNE